MLNITDISYAAIEDRIQVIDPEEIQFTVSELSPMIFAGNFNCKVIEYRRGEWDWGSISHWIEFHCNDDEKKAYCSCQNDLPNDKSYLCDHLAQAVRFHYQTIFGVAPSRVEVSETIRREIEDVLFLAENFTSRQTVQFWILRERYNDPATSL